MSTTWIIILSVLGGLIVGGLLAGWLVARSFGGLANEFLGVLFGGALGTRKKKK